MIFHLLAPTEESKETTEGQPAGGQGVQDWSESCEAPQVTKHVCLVPGDGSGLGAVMLMLLLSLITALTEWSRVALCIPGTSHSPTDHSLQCIH